MGSPMVITTDKATTDFGNGSSLPRSQNLQSQKKEEDVEIGEIEEVTEPGTQSGRGSSVTEILSTSKTEDNKIVVELKVCACGGNCSRCGDCSVQSERPLTSNGGVGQTSVVPPLDSQELNGQGSENQVPDEEWRLNGGTQRSEW